MVASSQVFIITWGKVTWSLVFKRSIVGHLLYWVEAYLNAGTDTRFKLYCGWGHIENKCSSNAKYSNCSGPHLRRDHTCNLVGSTAKQRSLSSHTLEKCPNRKGNYIMSSCRCVKTTIAAKMGGAQQVHRASIWSIHSRSYGHGNGIDRSGGWSQDHCGGRQRGKTKRRWPIWRKGR